VIERGEVWDADLGVVVRPVIVATREAAIPVLSRLVCVAVTKTVRGHPAEVELSAAAGVEVGSVANCDWLMTLSKDRLLRRRGRLDPVAVRRLNAAIVLALGLDLQGP
jgi:mRNA-degrading endonuclease toxin of MazEF toxin-antitoxin module